ncbi:MAG: HEPN domain-containing protein [Lachnoclostridium sp.]
MNSYYGTAENDYLFAKAGIMNDYTNGNYNVAASLCAQAAEKYMKAVIEVFDADNENSLQLMRTHNLRLLVNRLREIFADCPLSSKDYKWLGDFYYEARYPGDNFVMVNREDALESLRLVEVLKEWVDSVADKK